MVVSVREHNPALLYCGVAIPGRVHNTRAIKIGRRGDDQNWPRPGRIESVRKKEQRAAGGRSRVSPLSCVFLEIIAQRKLKVERAATLNLMSPERGSVAHGKKKRSACTNQANGTNVLPFRFGTLRSKRALRKEICTVLKT